MSLEIAVDKHRTYVRVTVSGSPSLEEFLSMLHLLGVKSEEWGAKAVLFDLRGIQSTFGPHDHSEMGLQVATSMPHMERVAALLRPERYTQVGERAGRRNGLDIRVFIDEATAVVWAKDSALDLPPKTEFPPSDTPAG